MHFKESLESRLVEDLSPTWCEILSRFALRKRTLKKSPFLSKRKTKLKRRILFGSKRNSLLLKGRSTFKKKKSISRLKKRRRKRFTSFWRFKRKKLTQRPLQRLWHPMILKSTLMLSIVPIWELR